MDGLHPRPEERLRQLEDRRLERGGFSTIPEQGNNPSANNPSRAEFWMQLETYHGYGQQKHHGDRGPTIVSKGISY